MPEVPRGSWSERGRRRRGAVKGLFHRKLDNPSSVPRRFESQACDEPGWARTLPSGKRPSRRSAQYWRTSDSARCRGAGQTRAGLERTNEELRRPEYSATCFSPRSWPIPTRQRRYAPMRKTETKRLPHHRRGHAYATVPEEMSEQLAELDLRQPWYPWQSLDNRNGNLERQRSG